MKFTSREKLLLIVLFVASMVIAAAIFTKIFHERNQDIVSITKKETIPKRAQVVKDYLDGKEVPAANAWWLHCYQHEMLSQCATIARFLNKDVDYIYNQLKLKNSVVVYRPRPENSSF